MRGIFVLFIVFVFFSNLFAAEAPEWINNPDMGGNIGAIGIVKEMDNKRKRDYIAKKLAIASLQERKRVLMESNVKTENEEMIATIKQSSSHFNDYEIIEKDSYSDGQNYYVWVVIKK